MADERVVVEPSLRVLGDDEVRPEAADLAGDVAPQVERRREVAIGMVEVDDLGHAQDVGRRPLLGPSRGRQLLGRDRRVLGALRAVGGDHVVDPRAAPGEQRDRRPGAELGVVGVADDDEHALERVDELVSFQGTHGPC